MGIQNSHPLACKGYVQSPTRTGYEQVVAHRTSDLFAFAARKPGKVISKKATGIVVEYTDGTKKGIELGRRFGSAAGLTIAHEVVSNLKEGDTFEAGDIISYNEGHFEADLINPKNVVLKAGVLANVVLLESTETHEDASSISRALAAQLTTKITKVKTIVVNFDQIIKNLVKPGQVVTHESILCVIEDAVTSNANLFDEVSLNTLRILSNQTPTAKVNGVVERVEVYYHGDMEDMSDSLRTLAMASDKEFGIRFRSQGKTAYTGSVTGDFRNEGEPLGIDCLAVKIYITGEVTAGVGDCSYH